MLPDGGRPSQQKPLNQVHAERPENIALLFRLHSLGHQLAVNLSREGDQGRRERPAGRVLIDAGAKAHVELDQIGPNLKDMPQARISRPLVINRHAQTLAAHGVKCPVETGVMGDRFVFRNLQDQTVQGNSGERSGQLSLLRSVRKRSAARGLASASPTVCQTATICPAF